MYGGEFVRYLGAIERPDTPPTPPLDLDVDVDVELMESEEGGPESPEIPPQEQTQDSKPEERQSGASILVLFRGRYRSRIFLSDDLCPVLCVSISWIGVEIAGRDSETVESPSSSSGYCVHSWGWC